MLSTEAARRGSALITYLERVLAHVDMFDQKLSDPRLHGGEELTSLQPQSPHALIAADVERKRRVDLLLGTEN